MKCQFFFLTNFWLMSIESVHVRAVIDSVCLSCLGWGRSAGSGCGCGGGWGGSAIRCRLSWDVLILISFTRNHIPQRFTIIARQRKHLYMRVIVAFIADCRNGFPVVAVVIRHRVHNDNRHRALVAHLFEGVLHVGRENTIHNNNFACKIFACNVFILTFAQVNELERLILQARLWIV